MPAVTLKISGEVAEQLHRAAAAAGRTLSEQVEHWARIAMTVEDRATVTEVNAIKQMRGDVANVDNPELRERVDRIISAFRSTQPATLRQKIGLDQRPVYEPDPESAGGVVRIDPDGASTRGRIEGRVFVPSAE